MDKIRQLLEKCGLSEEAANKICESLDNYKSQLKTQYDEEFQARLVKAKQVCLEETKNHKAELSRRVQIFLEAKTAAIDESLLRQSAQRETEAVARLEKVASLVEGIEPNSQSCSELEAEIKKHKRIAEQLVKERNAATEKARRLQGISERVLKQNRDLERFLAESASQSTPTQTPKRIDEQRSGGSRSTTQPTITETVGPTPSQHSGKKQATRVGPPKNPDEIAATMEEQV